MGKCIANVPRDKYNKLWKSMHMKKENKTYSMSIRVSVDELEMIKQASSLEAYASYSEFERRTALIKA